MPPYNYTDGNNVVSGFSSEIILELVKRTKLTMSNNRMQSVNWARAYKLLQENADAALFSMTRSEKREDIFKWLGPIASRTIWFWKLKLRTDIAAQSIAEIKNIGSGGSRIFIYPIYAGARP